MSDKTPEVVPFSRESLEELIAIQIELRKILPRLEAISLRHFAHIEPRNRTGSSLDLEGAAWNLRRALKLVTDVEGNELRRLNNPGWEPEFI